MRFLEGDIVRIAKDTCFYGEGGPSDPKDTNGIITYIDSIGHNDNDWFPISVKWDADHETSYREKDLKLVRRPEVV